MMNLLFYVAFVKAFFLFFTITYSIFSLGNNSCRDNILDLLGSKFLHQQNKGLSKSPYVKLYNQSSHLKITNLENSPENEIFNWLKYLEKTLDKKENYQRLKTYLFKKHLIKIEDFSDKYFKNLSRKNFDNGHGRKIWGEDEKMEHINGIIAEQRKSLENWIDYLFYSDSYPFWVKFWAFKGMVGLTLKREGGEFFLRKRSKNQISPFIELNREALSYAIDILLGRIKGNFENKDVKKFIKSFSFAKYYEWGLRKVFSKKELDLSLREGSWVKYSGVSDEKELRNSIDEYMTNWCLSAELTAINFLSKGDIYIYFSNDVFGIARVPRIAIRFEKEKIAEIRGVGAEQNLDSYMASSDILKKKLGEFGKEGENYYKRISDMALLTDVYEKFESEIPFFREELRFLYEIDEPMLSFGLSEDPRLSEILKKRNLKKDLMNIFEISSKEISLSEKYLGDKRIKVHYGDLIFESPFWKDHYLPEIVVGHYFFPHLELAQDLVFQDTVSYSISMPKLTSAKGVQFPRILKGNLDLNRLSDPEGLILPEFIEADLFLRRITNIKKLVLPKKVGGKIYLGPINFKEFELFIFPKELSGKLVFEL